MKIVNVGCDTMPAKENVYLSEREEIYLYIGVGKAL